MVSLVRFAVVLGLGLQVSAMALDVRVDGSTTYCWRIPHSYTVDAPAPSEDMLSGTGAACPISMTVALLDGATISPGAFVAVQWTVTPQPERLVGNSNALALGQYFKIDGGAEIVRSGVSLCAVDAGDCGPFSAPVARTRDEQAALDGAHVISFETRDELRAPETPGEYAVMAHIIMGANESTARNDYAVYTRLSVSSSVMHTKVLPVSSASDGQDSTGLSSTAIGIIVAGVVVVLLLLSGLYCFMRKHKKAKARSTEAAPSAFFVHGTGSPGTPPPTSLDKTLDFYADAGTSINALGNDRRQLDAPRPAAYVAYRASAAASGSSTQSGGTTTISTAASRPPRPIRRPGEPELFNREMLSGHRYVGETTRSYLYEAAVPSDAIVAPPPKIFSSKNSVDFMYPDSNRPHDIVDSTFSYSDTNDDSSRSHGVDSLGFVVDSNNSSRFFSYDDESTRSSRQFDLDDSSRSLQIDEHDESFDSRVLDTNQLRHLNIEI